MRQFVVGTGGQSLYEPQEGDAAWRDTFDPVPSEYFDAGNHGFLELDLGDGTYSWRFVTADGPITDSGSAACNAAAPGLTARQPTVLARVAPVTTAGDTPDAERVPRDAGVPRQAEASTCCTRPSRPWRRARPTTWPSESHRLAGTLGIFGFDDASVALRSLQRTAEDPDGGSDAIDDARTRTLAMLRGIATEQTSEEPG